MYHVMKSDTSQELDLRTNEYTGKLVLLHILYLAFLPKTMINNINQLLNQQCIKLLTHGWSKFTW